MFQFNKLYFQAGCWRLKSIFVHFSEQHTPTPEDLTLDCFVQRPPLPSAQSSLEPMGLFQGSAELMCKKDPLQYLKTWSDFAVTQLSH